MKLVEKRKAPTCPVHPRKPSEPKDPNEFHYFEQQFYFSNRISLKELIDSLPAGISPDDLLFESVYIHHEYDSESAVKILYKNKVPNSMLKSELKAFEKATAAYPAKLLKYEEELAQYNKDLEVWQLATAKADLRRAKNRLSKLTSKK